MTLSFVTKTTIAVFTLEHLEISLKVGTTTISFDNIGRSIIIKSNKKMGVNRLNPVQKATNFEKNQVGKMNNVQ